MIIPTSRPQSKDTGTLFSLKCMHYGSMETLGVAALGLGMMLELSGLLLGFEGCVAI